MFPRSDTGPVDGAAAVIHPESRRRRLHRHQHLALSYLDNHGRRLPAGTSRTSPPVLALRPVASLTGYMPFLV